MSLLQNDRHLHALSGDWKVAMPQCVPATAEDCNCSHPKLDTLSFAINRLHNAYTLFSAAKIAAENVHP